MATCGGGSGGGKPRGKRSVAATATLAPWECQRLAELEKTVEKGCATFLEVGLALMEIRDNKLYRQSHDTFETYCVQRWQFSRQHAYRLISAAQVSIEIESLSPMGDKMERGGPAEPAEQFPNERTIRTLAAMPATERRAVYDAANAIGGITVARLQELAAKALAGRTPEQQLEQIKSEEATVQEATAAQQRVEDEKRARANAEIRQIGGDARAGRIAQIRRLATRLRVLTEGLGGDAETALALLADFAAEIDGIAV